MLASRDATLRGAPELLAPPQQSSEGEAVSVLEGADASEASAEVLRFLLGMRDANEEEPAVVVTTQAATSSGRALRSSRRR